MISTLIQLYGDYQDEVNAVNIRYKELQSVHVESLTINLWELNEHQLNLHLEGLVKLPDISFVRVSSTAGHQSWQAGHPVLGDKISRRIPLEYKDPNTQTPFILGQLYVESSLERIYQQLLKTFLSVLITNAIKTFIVAALILWMFHFSINRRVMDMLSYLDHFRPSQRYIPLQLEQTYFVASDKDEISILAAAINQLSQSLTQLYTEIEIERDRFTDFANAASDWLWETDDSGRLIFASERLLNQLDLNKNDAYQQNFADLLQSGVLASALNARDDFKGLMIELHLKGEVRTFIFHAKFVQDRHQRPTMRGAAIEITSRKKTEQALQELNDTLEQRVISRTYELEQSVYELEVTQNQLIEREKMASLASLISGIAHEINTPLGVAITASSVLEPQEASQALSHNRDHKEPLSHHQEAFQLMQESLQRVVRLVQVFKQTAANTDSAKIEPVYLKFLLNDIVIGLQQGLQEKMISVSIECDDNLSWPTIIQSWVQIFHQMINNSIIHGFEKMAPDNHVKIYIRENDQGLEINYQDNGVGVSQEMLNKLFEPFQTSKRHQGCTGLGMHIVYNQVAQALHGTVVAQSILGQGLNISIQLPLLQEIEIPETGL